MILLEGPVIKIFNSDNVATRSLSVYKNPSVVLFIVHPCHLFVCMYLIYISYDLAPR